MRKQGGIMTRLLGNLGAGHKEAFETINHGNDGGMNHPTWGYQEVYLSQNHHHVVNTPEMDGMEKDVAPTKSTEMVSVLTCQKQPLDSCSGT